MKGGDAQIQLPEKLHTYSITIQPLNTKTRKDQESSYQISNHELYSVNNSSLTKNKGEIKCLLY